MAPISFHFNFTLQFKMHAQYIVLLSAIGGILAIYPYFDTQDFIYNVPKVFRISITLDKLLEYYEKKPSKDPEWYISLGIARGNLYSYNRNIKIIFFKVTRTYLQ